MIPVTALIAVIVTARRAGRAGAALAATDRAGVRARSRSTSISARACSAATGAASLGVLRGTGDSDRVITTVELGAAPLEYYLPPLHNLARGASVTVSEIDEIGYTPLRASAGQPAGARLSPAAAARDVNGLIVYRFVSATPAHGLRGDAAPRRDHRRTPRGARQ